MEPSGKVTIAPNVLITIVRQTALEQRGVHGLAPSTPNLRGLLAGGVADEGILVAVNADGVHVELHVIADRSANMLRLGEELQQGIRRAIKEMVGMEATAVNIYIDDVALAVDKASGGR